MIRWYVCCIRWFINTAYCVCFRHNSRPHSRFGITAVAAVGDASVIATTTAALAAPAAIVPTAVNRWCHIGTVAPLFNGFDGVTHSAQSALPFSVSPFGTVW